MLWINVWNLGFKYDKNPRNQAYQMIQIAVHMYEGSPPTPPPVTDRNVFSESILPTHPPFWRYRNDQCYLFEPCKHTFASVTCVRFANLRYTAALKLFPYPL